MTCEVDGFKLHQRHYLIKNRCGGNVDTFRFVRVVMHFLLLMFSDLDSFSCSPTWLSFLFVCVCFT
jgi:hypothetical protein